MIPQDAIEALARRNFEHNYDEITWAELPADPRQGWLEEAQAQCEAAAPFIRAQALEDAADVLRKLPYVKPDAEGRDGYERMLAIRRGDTDAWLRARAATERGQG